MVSGTRTGAWLEEVSLRVPGWEFIAWSEKNTLQTRNLILASYAKLYSNSNRFSLANIRKIKRTILPEREVKDEGDEV